VGPSQTATHKSACFISGPLTSAGMVILSDAQQIGATSPCARVCTSSHVVLPGSYTRSVTSHVPHNATPGKLLAEFTHTSCLYLGAINITRQLTRLQNARKILTCCFQKIRPLTSMHGHALIAMIRGFNHIAGTDVFALACCMHSGEPVGVDIGPRFSLRTIEIPIL